MYSTANKTHLLSAVREWKLKQELRWLVSTWKAELKVCYWSKMDGVRFDPKWAFHSDSASTSLKQGQVLRASTQPEQMVARGCSYWLRHQNHCRLNCQNFDWTDSAWRAQPKRAGHKKDTQVTKLSHLLVYIVLSGTTLAGRILAFQWAMCTKNEADFKAK